MCRAEAKEFWTKASTMKRAGAANVIALVKEDIGTEVADFKKGFWGGEVYLDRRLEYYSALGGGKVHKHISGVSDMPGLLAPWSKSRTKEALKRAGATPNNLKGEGFINGGCYVIATNGEAKYAFLEEQIGDRASVREVMAAIKSTRG